jgi:predicted metal-dependent enzyme (double-stranded beta helix superfamily)
MMTVAQQRQQKINETVSRIRDLIGDAVPDNALLQVTKEELLELAKHEDLFRLSDFPPPEAGSDRNSCLYRLSEDADHRFALYANVADGSVNAPPHDHTTWAVIVGLYGEEENRFYNRAEIGVSKTGSEIVQKGSGVTLLPDDLHSIHIKAGAPVLNFHMYGLALEQVPGRNYWSEKHQKWRVFPAHTDIREARV